MRQGSKECWWRIVFSTCFALFLISCGGDGGGGETLPGAGSLGIGIDDPGDTGILTLASREESLTVEGFVSESPLGKHSETGCFCGFACLYYPYSSGCYYTAYWPRVTVTLSNQTINNSSFAGIADDPDAPSEAFYRWSASIPLVVGENRIVVRADDGNGNWGSDALRVINP